MNTVEILILVVGALFSVLVVLVTFALWQYIQKKKENEKVSNGGYSSIKDSKHFPPESMIVHPQITLKVTTPQVAAENYDPGTLLEGGLMSPRHKRRQRLKKQQETKSNLMRAKHISKSLNSLDVTQQGCMSPLLQQRGRSGSEQSDVCPLSPKLVRRGRSGSEVSESGSRRNEKQRQISYQMIKDLQTLRKGYSSSKEKKNGKHRWALKESGHFQLSLGSLDYEDSGNSSAIDSDASGLDDSSGQIKKRLGTRRGSSLKGGTDLKVNGVLLVSTEYSEIEKTLILTIHRATNLGGEHRAESDINSYVKLYLLPHKKYAQQTNVVRGTKDPIFEEKIKFTELDLTDLSRHKLHFQIFNSLLMKKDELLGESSIFLSSLKYDQKEVFHLDVLAKKSKICNSAIRVSLCHQGTYSKLEVIIHEVKDLTRKSGSAMLNPYVRVAVYKDDSRDFKETQQKSNERNPEFNESFDFPVCTSGCTPLSTYSIAVTVMHHSLLRKDYALGHVIFSIDSPQESAEIHLREAENDPHRRVTQIHHLIDPDEI